MTELPLDRPPRRKLFGKRKRVDLAGLTLGYPESVACGFDSSWRLESILYHRDLAFVSVDGNDRNLAGFIFGNEQFTVRSAHSIGSLDRLVQRNIKGLSRLARSVDRNAIDVIRHHVVDVKCAYPANLCPVLCDLANRLRQVT